MASSPPAPFAASLPNPKKRPSVGSQASAQGVPKRPKLHPLRQTSFPAQDASGHYGSAVTGARSETGSVANSFVSGVSSKVAGRGRGRPKKSTQLNDEDVRSTHQLPADSSSQGDGGRTSGRGTKSVVSARSGAAEAEEDDEGDIDGMLENMDEQERQQAEEEETRQEQRRERLADTLDPDQYSRYNQWRALSLNNTTVKRLVNSIVSQSVTSAPLQAIRIYGKWFVGEIVERARGVQVEWAKAYEDTRKEERQRREKELESLEEKQKQPNLNNQQSQSINKDIERLKREVKEYIPNPHQGGLLPDHLREALRRYKADGEGGGVGFQGMSHGLLGVPGPAAWRVGDGASGKRLFR
ncbi:uncharacterized protein Z518_00850 [Rhinocladiella mackenziei CBS 650.93]|uniref:Rhinocladiella mackenziei CBS 650.93 unplaced genomic scaffold supercont1.1, whole genome shotgun sequence n=1 Tax=Rhinocladiella mackenziei CBS 650.93 TaxID=1442369 RepID=A0A0D2IUK7_9EURO|nr:uncharacterized protein Z518_00850 [Rhinocladiella mackenziei CBS 650.93]KIX09769.1 hypothetical protein Z518_00850 [Rhinocladiella mackenziei CBS 650.93]